MVKGKTPKLKEKPSLKATAPKRELDPLIYWVTLLVLVTSSMFSSIVLIPLLLLSSSFNFYLTIALIAIFFGYVFTVLITRLENLSVHHHIFAAFIIPAFSLINMVIISNSTAGVARILGLQTDKNPIIVSAFYLVFFIFPYAVHLIRKKLYK